MINKVYDIVRETEEELKEAEAKMLKSKDKVLKADVLKTVKAMGYERIKAITK